MRTIIRTAMLAVFAVNMTACGASIQIASRRDVVGVFDSRPQLSIVYNGSDADFVDLSDDRGVLIARNLSVGGTIIVPVTIYQQFGEYRTFFIKGYRRFAGDSTKVEYIGFRCRQIYLQQNQQPQPWIVDRLVRPGEQATGCY